MSRSIIAITTVVALALGIPSADARGSHASHPSRSYRESDLATQGTYTNVDGRHVHRPSRTVSGHRPAGASAHCSDGSWSFSRHARGTCSHHGGIG